MDELDVINLLITTLKSAYQIFQRYIDWLVEETESAIHPVKDVQVAERVQKLYDALLDLDEVVCAIDNATVSMCIAEDFITKEIGDAGK